MVIIKSNVDKVIKSFTKFRNAVSIAVDTIAERLAKAMVQDMEYEIQSNASIWSQPNGNLETIGSIDYNITRTNENTIRITLGENLKKIQVGNTKYSLPQWEKLDYINPLYFIEFGWGVVGENDKKEGATKYDWSYNVNEHGRITQDPFFFWGKDGTLIETRGREGINFLYNTIEKYREQWKPLLIYIIRENLK